MKALMNAKKYREISFEVQFYINNRTFARKNLAKHHEERFCLLSLH